MEILDKALSDCVAVSFVQKLLSSKELGSNYNISRNQTVRNQAIKSSCCGCYKVTLLFCKLIKLHLNSCYFRVLIVHFGKLFQNVGTRNLLIFSFNFFMASFVFLAVFF